MVGMYLRRIMEAYMLRAPSMLLFIVAAVLALIGIAEHLSLMATIPGLSTASAIWAVFFGWFLLAIASVLPKSSA